MGKIQQASAVNNNKKQKDIVYWQENCFLDIAYSQVSHKNKQAAQLRKKLKFGVELVDIGQISSIKR